MENLLMPYVWNLSEEATEQLEKTEIGETVNIDEQMTPAVFQMKEDIYLFAFTSEKSIPEEYIKDYAIVKVDVKDILIEFFAVENILGKTPLLIVNPFDEMEIIAKEQLEKMI